MKIILASSSPRRIQLLTQAGLKFKVVSPKLVEKVAKGESPKNMVKRLARQKAHEVLEKLLSSKTPPVEHTLIIGADTTVVAPNGKTIFGKPKSVADATRMLTALSGQTHTVLTSYCLLFFEDACCISESVRTVSTRVKISKITRTQIQNYVATEEPMDKAGSYAAQGMGSKFIESISGSYSNVVGLPLAQLMSDLADIEKYART